MATKEELLTSVLQLSESERAEVAYELLRSLDDVEDQDAVEAWTREIERRADDLLSGRVQGVDGRNLLSELARDYPRRT